MQPQTSDLDSLERRLHHLVTQYLDDRDASIKPENHEIDPSLPRYLCAECAWYTTNSRHLANHFRVQHLPFSCRMTGCPFRCASQDAIDRHRRSNHGIACPHENCLEIFTSTSELQRHIGEFHTAKNSSTIFQCPYPDCGQGFSYYNALLEHYDGLHPPYIYQQGKKAPYKCPFCIKRYIKERYMTPHVRSHLANRWAPSAQGDGEQDQGALIRQSYAAAAEKALQVPEEPHVALEQASNDHEPLLDEEPDYSTTIVDGRLYIDDELILSSPTWGDSNGNSVPSSPELEISTEHSKRMKIGYVLEPQSTDTSMPDTEDDDDEYPEAFALDDDELPQMDSASGRIHSADGFSNSDQGRKIFSWVLQILGLHEWIGVGEIIDLWTHLLEPQQRIQILQQFHEINVEEDEDRILSILRSSTISELIHAWASFKLTAFQRRRNGVPRACAAKITMCSLVQYCIALEEIIDEGRLTAMTRGYTVPDLVRRPPPDRSLITLDTTIEDLIEALAERVKCRMVHERWVQFTNVLVLKEAKAYILDLKVVARAMYPFSLHGQEWYHIFRLDRD